MEYKEHERSTTRATASSTNEFYAEHADEYFDRTVGANLEHLYQRFLPLLPAGAQILDAGCGSGRDMKAFKERGYRPYGIDASPDLVRLAHKFSGVECEVKRLQDVDWDAEFDGVWACASLLHLPKRELPLVLSYLRKALRTGGALFATVQSGVGERLAPDGRFFADYMSEEFLLSVRLAGFNVVEAWQSEDALPNRRSVGWVNVTARAA